MSVSSIVGRTLARFALLPCGEKVPYRGEAAIRADEGTSGGGSRPHPALRATFSPGGEKGETPRRSAHGAVQEGGGLSRGGLTPQGRDILAIGVGFRKRCAPDTLTALVRDARDRLAQAHPALAGASAVLATIAEKDRPALHEAAATLGLAVLVLPKGALLGTEDRITVASAAARACFGVPSVAEAAALAAAGPGARLLLSRISVADATCAIASTATSASEAP